MSNVTYQAMRIGIDGNEANTRSRVGIGQYAYQLLVHLYGQKNPDDTFDIYLKDNPLPDMPEEDTNWKYHVFGPKKLWTQIALPIRLFQGRPKPQVFFTPTHYAPRFAPCKRIISVMDLSFIFFPELFTKRDLYKLTNWTKYSVEHAAKIMTISKYSKQTIADHYKIDPEKIVVTYPGYNREKYISRVPILEHETEELRTRYSINGQYILFVGTIQPRKNISRLIEAFELLYQKHKDIQLVLAGKKGWLYEGIFEKSAKSPATKAIKFISYVHDKDIAALYRNAQCFILPSLYEGFGLPPIEAMACACPTIVSDVTSLPEVVGEAALKVNPENTGEIADALEKACYNKVIRTKLIKAGLERVKFFSWEECAKRTYEVLQSIK